MNEPNMVLFIEEEKKISQGLQEGLPVLSLA